MSTITIGIFESGEDAQRAISQLVETGVEQGDLHPIRRQQNASDGQGILGSLFRAVGFGTGDVSNELTRLGVDQEEAGFYEEALGDDSVLLAVEASDENADDVMAIMRKANATFRES
ncbi:MAG: hypothetical protein U5J97_01855 [Trueperaceae bacterium]|nr:hypothetical protein [Trueperaceae bacterium]